MKTKGVMFFIIYLIYFCSRAQLIQIKKLKREKIILRLEAPKGSADELVVWLS